METYLQGLKGINYPEWVRLRTSLDQYFENEKSELERGIKLASVETVLELNRLQFGRR